MILCHTMNDRSKIRPIQFFLPLLSIFFLFYFLYHTFEGDRGVTALLKVKSELSIVQKELSEAKILQASLERRNALLLSSNLDTDMLSIGVGKMFTFHKGIYIDPKVVYDTNLKTTNLMLGFGLKF